MERAANLSRKEKWSFGIGGIGKDMAFNIVSGFYMLYLTLVVGLDAAIVGLAFALTRVFDALNDPIMGTIVDNKKTKWGKFRPWLLIGTLLNAVILILMHMDFNLGKTPEYFYYLSMYVIWGVTYTLMDVPYWAMIPAISGTKKERNEISSFARIFTSIGAAMTGGVIPIILGKFGYDNKIFLMMGIITAFSFIFFMTFTVLFTKEKIVVPTMNIKFKDIFKTIRKNDQLIAYLSTYGLYAIGTTVMMTAGVYYFKVVLNNESLMTVFLAIGGGLGGGVAMIIYPFLAKKFSRRRIYVTALYATVAGFLFMAVFAFFKMNYALSIVGLMLGGWMFYFSQSITAVGSTVMLADVVDYGEYKLGNRNENITFSMQTFVYKCAAAVSSLIMGFALKIAEVPQIKPDGTFDGTVTDFGKTIIKIVIFILPIFFILPSLFFYFRLYKLNGEYYDNIIKELYHRRDENKTNN